MFCAELFLRDDQLNCVVSIKTSPQYPKLDYHARPRAHVWIKDSRDQEEGYRYICHFNESCFKLMSLQIPNLIAKKDSALSFYSHRGVIYIH